MSTESLHRLAAELEAAEAEHLDASKRVRETRRLVVDLRARVMDAVRAHTAPPTPIEQLAARRASEPVPGKRLSLSERLWASHREGLLDAKGLALHRQWRKSATLRMVDLEAGATLDLVLAYAAEQGIALQVTEPF